MQLQQSALRHVIRRYALSPKTPSPHWHFGVRPDLPSSTELKADVNNLAIDGVSLEGNTGVGELSATYRKSADSPWAASVALKGYVGQRQGAAGQVRLDYRF